MAAHVSRNIFWLTASRVASLLLLFLAYTQLFRYLGPERYGQLALALSFVAIFGTFVDFGVQQFVVKRMAEAPGERARYFRQFFAFELVAASLLYGALLLAARLNGYTAPVFGAVALAGAGMAVNALCYPFLSVLSATQDMRRVAFVNFLNSCVNAAVILGGIWLGRGVVFLAGTQLAFGVLDLAVYSRYLKRHLPGEGIVSALRAFDPGPAWRLAKTAWPFVLLVGFSSIYNRIDTVLISHLLGYEANGLYGAAYKIFDLLAFFPAVVSYSLYPHLTELMAAGSVASVRLLLERYTKFALTLAFPLGVGGMVLAEQIIGLVAGPGYSHAVSSLRVLAWAPAILLVYIPVNALVISQLTRQAAAATAANVVLNVAGNLILLPRYGIVGAASMTIVSELLQAVVYFTVAKRNITDFNWLGEVWKPALSSAVMGAVLVYFRGLPFLPAVAVGSLTYAACVLALGHVRPAELRAWVKLGKLA